MSSLLDQFTSKPTAPPVARSGRKEVTSKIEVKGDTITVESNSAIKPKEELTGDARNILEENGLNPDEYEVTGFRSSKWTMANGDEGVSTRFTFALKPSALHEQGRDISEIVEVIRKTPAPGGVVRATGEHCFIVALGDMQFGKDDGDGAEGTLKRVLDGIDEAARTLAFYRQRFDIGHIHVAWLGDHIEGFVSQGGANTYRTHLPLNDQIRLVRRVMTHAMLTFAPLAQRVTMVAVPGNHGEPQRFSGKGVTRYDDSHDTEALIAVSEAASLDPDRFGHVEFYVPETDEMTVTLDLAGTVTVHAHGHQFRPGQHFKWWQGQTFGGKITDEAKLLLLGHLHHEMIESSGERLVLQVPALESTSKWWEHNTGTQGNPGVVVAITKGGHTWPIEVLR